MVYAALFIIVALLELSSAVLVFFFRDIVHTVLSLSLLFVFNSVMFLILGQPLLALLQLFVMVGGVATYIFVGVGSASYSKFKSTDYKVLAVAYAFILVVFLARLANVGPIEAQQNILSSQIISQFFISDIGLVYLLTVMLFGVGFGSILLMKKLGEK